MSAISGETLLRSGVIAADDSVPAVAQAAVDLTGSPFATLAFSVAGTTPSFTVYPLLWNTLLDKYVRGDAYTITADTEVNIAVNGTVDFYIYVSAVSGDDAAMDVSIKPALL